MGEGCAGAGPELLVMARAAATAVGLPGASPAVAALLGVLTGVSSPPPPRAKSELLEMARPATTAVRLPGASPAVAALWVELLVMAQAAVPWRSPPPRVSRLPAPVQ